MNIQSVDIALVFLALILQYNQFVKVHLSLATAVMSLSDTQDQKSNPSIFFKIFLFLFASFILLSLF